MTRGTVVPLNQIDRRMAEAGRIRMGEKTAKAMRSIDRFRFTSPDEGLIKQIAALYGGTAEPWHEPKANPSDQWQVKIEADKINVILPPDSLDQWYELWAGSGCVRRCDGEQCETPTQTGDGYAMTSVPCMCDANQLMECKPHTRLKVILPGVDLHGVWRLETKGWNALHELPGMVDLIEAMTARGRIVQAQLSIEKQEKMVNRRKSNFVVPKIELPFTPEQLVAGAANLGALTTGTSPAEVPALGPGMSSEYQANIEGFTTPGVESDLMRQIREAKETHDQDDDIAEAELVSPEEIEVIDCARQYGMDPRRFWKAIEAQAGGDVNRIKVAIAKMKSGDLQPEGFDSQGRIVWAK